MPGLHSLDRIIGDAWPILATDDELRAFESVPFEERIAARGTYEALRCGAAREPKEPAILFLANASPRTTGPPIPCGLLRA
jgi:fatty-acyl-CoA synthase